MAEMTCKICGKVVTPHDLAYWGSYCSKGCHDAKEPNPKMAEMTAAEAQGFFHPKHGEIITFEGGLNYVVGVEDGESIAALIGQQVAEIERLKVENNRLRVCCNCRHFEWPKCTVSGKRTTRASICRDWEMV